MNTFGTVRCPVISARAPWMAPPSSRVSSSTTSGETPTSANTFFALVQNGQYVFWGARGGRASARSREAATS